MRMRGRKMPVLFLCVYCHRVNVWATCTECIAMSCWWLGLWRGGWGLACCGGMCVPRPPPHHPSGPSGWTPTPPSWYGPDGLSAPTIHPHCVSGALTELGDHRPAYTGLRDHLVTETICLYALSPPTPTDNGTWCQHNTIFPCSNMFFWI